MGFDFYDDNSISEHAKESTENLGSADMEKTVGFDEIDKISEEGIEADAPREPEISVKKSEASEKKEANIRKFLAQIGDSSIEVPADAKFKHKVDGADVEVTAEELLNNYSGKQAWDKRFSELDKDRQGYKKDLESVNAYITEFARRSKENPTDALEYLASSVGLDALEFRKKLKENFVASYGDYAKLSPEERRLRDIEEENAHYRSQRESQSRLRQEEQARRELDLSIKREQESHGIDDSRLELLVSDLRKHGGTQNVSMKDVVELHQAYKRQDVAFAVLEKLNPEFVTDDSKFLMLESLQAGNSKLTEAELLSHATKLWGSNVSKSEKAIEKKVAPKKVNEQVKRKTDDGIPFLGSRSGQVDFF